MKSFLVLLMACLIFSCSDNKTTDSTSAETSNPNILLNTQIDSLEKAKQVEQSLQEMTEAREEKMRQQGI